MSAHSLIAPSSASRWVHCHGSARMEQSARDAGEVEDNTDESMEGEAAHQICAALLTDVFPPEAELGYSFESGVVVDEEMIEAAKMYASHVSARTDDPVIEERLDISAIHPECFGTPDCWGWETGRLSLHIWDFKYGHLFVDAWENWQCICYAAGILAKYPQLDDTQVEVNIHVVQPRNYDSSGPIRTWTTRASDLRAHFNVLKFAAAKALSAEPDTKATPGGCRDCAARHRCPTFQRATMEAAHIAGHAVPLKLSAEALGHELRTLEYAQKMIDARITGLSEQGLARAKRGENIPFYEITESRPRERWNEPNEKILALFSMLGHDIAKPAEPITPVQARKLGIAESVISEYAERPRGELCLTFCSTTKAKKVFAK